MRLSDVSRHPVVDLSSATTVAQLDDVAIDPAARQVLGFSLRKAVDGHQWLPWARVHALGADAATVADTSAFTATPADARLLGDIGALGRRVLSTDGVEVGTLADLEVAPETGAITALILADGSALAGEDLLGVGRYATVVRTAAGLRAP